MSSPYVTSETLFSVIIFVDISKPGEPRVLTDMESAKLDPDKLPENIRKETSHWRRPNWTISTLITKNSYTEDNEGRQRFDITKFATARLRCLLVDWSLKDEEPTLALDKIKPPEMPAVELLSDTGLRTIGMVDTVIIEGFYARAMNKIYPQMNLLGGVVPLEMPEGN